MIANMNEPEKRWRKKAQEHGYDSEREMLYDFHILKSMTATKIARLLDYKSAITVKNRIKKNGIPYSGWAGQDAKWLLVAKDMGYYSEAEMFTALLKDKTCPKIARQFGVSKTTIYTRLKRHGIRLEPSVSIKKGKLGLWEKKAKQHGYWCETEMLYDLHVAKEMTPVDIGSFLGVSSVAIRNRMKKCNIKLNKKIGRKNRLLAMKKRNAGKSNLPVSGKQCIVPGCTNRRRDKGKYTRYCALCYQKIKDGILFDEEFDVPNHGVYYDHAN